jgi:hypothetical protein
LLLITRFSATEDDDGWTKSTVCRDPTLKLCQLIAVRWLDCVIVVVRGLFEIDALPAVTTPPVGRALAAGCARVGVTISRVATVPSAVHESNVARPRPAVPISLAVAGPACGQLAAPARIPPSVRLGDDCRSHAIRRSSMSGGLAWRCDRPSGFDQYRTSTRQ